MNLKPHKTDVIHVTGHAIVDGHDIHGMYLIVDAVDRDLLVAHLSNNRGNIHLAVEDVEVACRTNFHACNDIDWGSL